MIRSRSVGFAVLVLATAGALAGCGGGVATDGEKDGEKMSPAELIVGTWTEVQQRGIPRRWYESNRVEYRADGTFRFTSNDPYLVVWKEGRTGRYKLSGQVVHYSSPLTPAQRAQNAKSDAKLHETWEVTIDAISETELVLTAGPPNEREQHIRRRVR